MSINSWNLGIDDELKMVEGRMRELVSSPQDKLTEIALHVIEAGGKRLRPTLAILSHHALQGNNLKKLIEIAAALELIHSATLVHDDINDGAEIRRGREAAYRKYGLHEAVVTGDFLFARAFYIGGMFNKSIIELVANSTMHLAEGEMLQYLNRRNPNLSVDQYMKIIEGKTAYPIRASTQIGVFMADGNSDELQIFGEYGLNLGITFQIVDDILDVVGDEHEVGKMPGSDLREGTLTLPIILARDGNNGLAGKIEKLFSGGKPGNTEIQECLDMVKESGGVSTAMEIAKGYADGALEYLESVPESEHRDKLSELADLILHRTA